MHGIFLLGVALNYLGAATLFAGALQSTFNEDSSSRETLQLKFFTSGTAAVFGSMYLYFFFNPSSAMPFLIFGAVLKTWAFILSVFLFLQNKMQRKAFFEFGIANGIVGAAFWYYIAAV